MKDVIHREAVEYLKSKGGSCDWQDMTVKMSHQMLDACLEGLIISCDITEMWILVNMK